MKYKSGRLSVYLIAEEVGFTKIGIGREPEKILRSLQTGNPNDLLIVHSQEYDAPVAEEMEKYLHHYFSGKRSRENGEWFELGYTDIMDAHEIMAAGKGSS